MRLVRGAGAVAVAVITVIAGACAEKRTEVKPAPAPVAPVVAKAPPVPADAPFVVVDDLEGEGIPDLGRFSADLARGVAQSGRAQVVVRSEIAAKMKTCTEVDCQQLVGAPLVAARYVVHGSANKLGDSYIVQIKLLQPGSASVLARVNRQGSGELAALLFEAGREVGAALPAK